jgi:uncharacterized protein involved in exopolysaccharide biosynthesis
VRIDDASAAAEIAKGRLDEAETAWQKAAGARSTEALRLEISDDSYLKSQVEEQLLDEQGPSRARVELLQRRMGELTRAINENSAALAHQSAREQDLQAVLTAARTSYEAAAQRLADLRNSQGSRMEWLHVVDPGTIPEKPSSPNVPVIVIGAAALALFSSFLYLTISFSLTRVPRRYRPALRVATHGAD